jgi:ParB family transcriptional regulator, chromosome partitioning protein
MQKKTLGKGLSALIKSNLISNIESNSDSSSNNIENFSNFSMIRIIDIQVNPYQPRKFFDEIKLEELSESIKENGIITPITVRKKLNGFELIAGERRLRAAKKLNILEIPCYIIDTKDEESCAIAILENTQREDLSPIEEAFAYQNLIDTFSYTQEMISRKTGKSRSHIANLLRILQLPEEIQKRISNNQISLGHAKILLQSKNPIELCNQVIKNNISVRNLEEIVKKESLQLFEKPKPLESDQKHNLHERIQNIKKILQENKNQRESKDIEILRLEDIFFNKTSIKTNIINENEKYIVSFECNSTNELENLLHIINRVD